MKKVALGMAVAATALAGPAIARDNYAYFGADIGYADPEDHDIANNGWDDGSYILEDDGFDLGAFLGYDWGAIRTEAEISYKEFDAEGVNIGVIGAPLFDTVAPFDSGLYALAGESELTTIMANAMLDLGGNDGIGLSLGVGAGRAMLESTFLAAPWNTYLADSDSTWAYQGIAALRIPVTTNAELGLKYKYLNTNEFSMQDSALRSYETELAVH